MERIPHRSYDLIDELDKDIILMTPTPEDIRHPENLAYKAGRRSLVDELIHRRAMEQIPSDV